MEKRKIVVFLRNNRAAVARHLYLPLVKLVKHMKSNGSINRVESEFFIFKFKNGIMTPQVIARLVVRKLRVLRGFYHTSSIRSEQEYSVGKKANTWLQKNTAVLLLVLVFISTLPVSKAMASVGGITGVYQAKINCLFLLSQSRGNSVVTAETFQQGYNNEFAIGQNRIGGNDGFDTSVLEARLNLTTVILKQHETHAQSELNYGSLQSAGYCKNRCCSRYC